MFSQKRLLITAATVATIGSAVVLVIGVTFGLFSATSPAQSGTFTAGTVTLDQTKTITCVVGTLSPGDGSYGSYNTESGANAQCSLPYSYTGNVPAYLAVDVSVSGTAGTSTPYYGGAAPAVAPGLFDGSANGLQLVVKSTGTVANTFITGTQFTNGSNVATNVTGSCSGNGSESGCAASGTVNDLLIGQFAPTNTGTITVDYGLPTAANNAYQNAATTITLTVHAVQANNNASVAACTNSHQCTSGSWS
ncbi:MAG TPA: hypothetical protein VG815_04830 [Chloroflexota bacterium]|jgi:hypothetical protein|nr:hypothetical protein [Chloroflexota bacterium]